MLSARTLFSLVLLAPLLASANGTLATLTTNNSSIQGGGAGTGILGFRTTNNAAVELTSSNPAVLAVPARVFGRADQNFAWFPITTVSPTSPTVVTITAKQKYYISTDPLVEGFVTLTAQVTVNPSATPPAPDTVTILQSACTKASGGCVLTVVARSTNPYAILEAFSSSGSKVFTFKRNPDGTYTYGSTQGFRFSPLPLTVKSHFGGVAIAR